MEAEKDLMGGREAIGQKGVRRLIRLSFLTALALSLYVIELYLPFLPAVLGMKVGLANIVTVYTVVHFSGKEAFLVLVARILCGVLLSGYVSALPFSLAGGTAALLGCLLLHRYQPGLPFWFLSAVGGWLHNTGQIALAVFILSSVDVLWYYPILVLAGILTGLATGKIAELLDQRLAWL